MANNRGCIAIPWIEVRVLADIMDGALRCGWPCVRITMFRTGNAAWKSPEAPRCVCWSS